MLFFLFLILASAAKAQEEPPAPYAGLKNPLPWADPSAQEAGKKVYQQSCLGCHGANGRNLRAADLGAPDFPEQLEQRADYYFWILSEGRLDKGMPPFKSSLSEQQRWQLLNYSWSLGKAATPPKEATPPPAQPAAKPASLALTAPARAQTGQPLTLTANLKDGDGKPIENAIIEFFIKVDFFTSGLMKIGETATDSQGIATLRYSPRLTGDLPVVAHYQTIEASAALSLAEANGTFYQPEVGIRMPAIGDRDVFIGPQPAHEPGETTLAPKGSFRLPGGMTSWLLLVVATVILIWTTYFRVVYQVFRIPAVKDITDTDTRLAPRIGLGIIVALGIMLVLVLLRGPYTHLHLPG